MAPFMVQDLTANIPLSQDTSYQHAALAAAEAGVQWYRNELDSVQNYATYGEGQTAGTDGDPAMSGWCSTLCDLGGTNPAESFHYVPNDNYLNTSSGPYANQMLVTVTGRAGHAGSYSYNSLQATFSRSSILDNAYFTSIEAPDPIDTFYQNPTQYQYVITCPQADVTGTMPNASCNCPSGINMGSCQVYPMTGITLGTVFNSSQASNTNYTGKTVWQSICQQTNWTPNALVTWLGIANPNQSQSDPPSSTYTSQYPYYGPYFGSANFSFVNSTSTYAAGTVVEIPGAQQGCYQPHAFGGGETFDGPFYSQDQIYISGNPAFDGGSSATPSLSTNASPSTVYSWDVQGSVKIEAYNQIPYGPYPANVPATGTSPAITYTDHYWAPVGVTTLPNNYDSATYLHGPLVKLSASDPGTTSPALGVDETLPGFNSYLSGYAAGTYSGGGTGCYFTGPTTIQLVYGGSQGSDTASSEYMNVWSPLSSITNGTNCGTFDPADHFYQSHLAMPSNGVVYVADCPSTKAQCSGTNGNTSSTTPCAAATGSTFGTVTNSGPTATPTAASDGCGPCFNPLIENLVSAPSTTTNGVTTYNYPGVDTCDEGDVFVGGEVAGGLTIGSAANIDITRALTYACADGAVSSGVANGANPSTIPACETSPDILGLNATNNILLSMPLPGPPTVGDPQSCAWNGVGTPGTESGSATEATQLSDIWPNCDPSYSFSDPVNSTAVGEIVDGALLALSGALTTQNWNDAPDISGVNALPEVDVEGTDISYYRGLFGDGQYLVQSGNQPGEGNEGYNKDFNYDTRLNYLTPPDLLSSEVAVWRDVGYTLCGTAPPTSLTSGTASCPALH